MLCPQLRQTLLRISRLEAAKDLARQALTALSGFVTAWGIRYEDIEVGIDYPPEPGLADNGDLELDLQILLFLAGRSAAEAGGAWVGPSPTLNDCSHFRKSALSPRSMHLQLWKIPFSTPVRQSERELQSGLWILRRVTHISYRNGGNRLGISHMPLPSPRTMLNKPLSLLLKALMKIFPGTI